MKSITNYIKESKQSFHIFDESKHSFRIKSHLKKDKNKELTLQEFKDEIVYNYEFAITVHQGVIKDYALQTTDVFILEAGDSHIGKLYGQDVYNDDSLEGQDLDGRWADRESKYTIQNNVLRELKERTGIDCCHNITKDDQISWQVWFEETEFIKIGNNVKIFDVRK